MFDFLHLTMHHIYTKRDKLIFILKFNKTNKIWTNLMFRKLNELAFYNYEQVDLTNERREESNIIFMYM